MVIDLLHLTLAFDERPENASAGRWTLGGVASGILGLYLHNNFPCAARNGVLKVWQTVTVYGMSSPPITEVVAST